MKRNRQKKIKARKNFFPTLVVTALLWSLTLLLVYFVEPDTSGVIPLFILLIFLSLLFTFATIFANSRRGFLAAFGLTLFLILRILGIGNIINLLLLGGLLLTIELYFHKKLSN